MLTFKKEEFYAHPPVDQAGDSSFGNRLFFIAGTIGIAEKNGYEWAFPEWQNSKFFVNPLPIIEPNDFPIIQVPWGFNGFDYPDNSQLYGWMQSEKYFEHCSDVIRYYFQLYDMTPPIKDKILIHLRAYSWELSGTLFHFPTKEYFEAALTHLPKKEVVVVTDSPERARAIFGNKYEIESNSSIVDFYLLTKADYIVMSPSSFSWWGAWLSRAVTVAPRRWFAFNQSSEQMYCKDWIVI